MTFKELRLCSGMSRTEFAKYFGVSYRTVQSWEVSCESNARVCPNYLLELMKYKLEKEGILKAGE